MEQQGHVLTFGCDGSAVPSVCGLLGHGDGQSHSVPRPTLVKGLSTYNFPLHAAAEVACGMWHFLVREVTESGGAGRIFAWGLNDCGCLGVGDASDRCEPAQVQLRLSAGDAVKQMAAGETHSVFLSEMGRVLVCGAYFHGRLLAESDARVVPEELAGLKDRKVVEVRSGAHFSVAVTDDGKLFAWGNNDVGQLGQGHRRDLGQQVVQVPLPDSISQVKQLFCQGQSVILLDQGGQLYSWGFNDDGRLGLGDVAANESAVCSPTLLPAFAARRVVMLGGGISHSIALCEDGRTFAWGSNAFGQIGVGHLEAVDGPRVVELEGGAEITSIACGFGFHSFVTAKGGGVFGWGRNEYGQLGLGDTTDRVRPTSIPRLSSRQVIVLACGLYVSVAVMRGPAESS